MSFIAEFADCTAPVTVTYTRLSDATAFAGVAALRYPTGYGQKRTPGPAVHKSSDTTFIIDVASLTGVTVTKNDTIVQGSESFSVEKAERFEDAEGPWWLIECRRVP